MTTKLPYVMGYAVVRVDVNMPLDPPSEHEIELNGQRFITSGPSNVTVKEILLSADEARREVDRLNNLNAAKNCAYYWQTTHIFLDGGSHGSTPINSGENSDANSTKS